MGRCIYYEPYTTFDRLRSTGGGMRSWVSVVLLMLATSAQAQTKGWEISSTRDRMNDRDVKYAQLASKAVDHGVAAILGFTCSKEMGARYFTLSLSKELLGSRIGGSYRVDNESEELRNFYVMNGLIAFIEAPPFDLIKRKRFRIQLQVPRQPTLFYDFDLTGLPAAAKTIGCG